MSIADAFNNCRKFRTLEGVIASTISESKKQKQLWYTEWNEDKMHAYTVRAFMFYSYEFGLKFVTIHGEVILEILGFFSLLMTA